MQSDTEESSEVSGQTSKRITYEDIAVNCFRYLNFKSFEEVDRLFLDEYELLMKAVRLKRVDREYEIHLQAYINQVAKSTKKVGKHSQRPVYQKFSDLFDYEERVNTVLGIVKQPVMSDSIIKLMIKANNLTNERR